MTPASARLAWFAATIATRLGLHVAYERCSEVVTRRAAVHREAVTAYLDRFDPDDVAEVRALAGLLTIGETYFLRHIEQFRAFADVAVPDRLARGRLHVLSAGC